MLTKSTRPLKYTASYAIGLRKMFDPMYNVRVSNWSSQYPGPYSEIIEQ
jgi:hypothetical protein